MNPLDRSNLATSMMQMRSAVLQRNAALQQAAGAVSTGAASGAQATQASDGDFANVMRKAVSQVNSLQADAAAASEAIERGTSTDIAGAMIARQKASLGFEATLQVRNKLLSAYQDIMNMPL